MGDLITYFLPFIIALGLITSYDDIKKGKIYNKYIVASLIIGLLINIILYFLNIIKSVRYLS